MASQPDVGDVHVNALLTNMSIAHRNAADFYIADRVFPLVGVDKQSDIYLKYNRGDFFADEGERMKRAPGTQAATTGFSIDKTNTYFASNYAIGLEIPDELRSNQDQPLDMDRDGTYLLGDLQMIRRERSWAVDHMTTTVWGTDKTVNNKWSDYAASDPFGDLEDGLDTVEADTGMRPNKLVMGSIVWRRLKHHPDFIDRIKGGATTGNPAGFTKELLAAMLDIDQVLISRAIYRSSEEGAAVTTARIVDDDALLIYTPPSPSLLTPAAGYTFYWRPQVGADIQYMRRGRNDRNRYDWLEAQSYFDHVVTESKAGYFFPDVVD